MIKVKDDVFQSVTQRLTFKNFTFHIVSVISHAVQLAQGRSQDFSKEGGGGHTGSNNIVMAFSSRYIVGCLLKKRLTKGGVTATPSTPLATPMLPSHTSYISVLLLHDRAPSASD